MAIEPFLAMTPAEMQNCLHLPSKIAWMACHFSPCGRGLSNLPTSLPEGFLLVLDDSTPIQGHDPEAITQQLQELMRKSKSAGMLLDFQRPDNPETASLTARLSATLPCPVITSEHYAENGPVFLSPPPPSVLLQDYFSPWEGRDIWLDLGFCGEILRLTAKGCHSVPLGLPEFPEDGFADKNLHCHYQIQKTNAGIDFTLWRTPEDLASLLGEAETLGIRNVVGLYQELYPFFK